ncbi:MAG: hypothetical protein BalsKO_32160 [Balneolaceae bacterium]
MNNRNRRVNIIGPFPPPFGGISVHIKRIFNHIKKENVQFYNTSEASFKRIPTLTKSKLFLLFFKFDQLIHYHSTSINVRLVLALYATINPFIYLHAHGASLTDQLKLSTWKSTIIKLLLPKLNLICSNSEIYDYMKSTYSTKSLHLFDAFIPPKYDEKLDREILNSIEWPNSKYLLSMTGWFNRYNDQDLYGYDIMLNALHELRKNNIDVSVIASVNGIGNQELYSSFIAERDHLSLNDNFLLIMYDLQELYPIIIKSDIFVRPTNTDGNAVSIKEAIWFDIPVIASDVVPRPDEAIIFKNRSVESLVNVISKQLDKVNTHTNHKIYSSIKFEHPMIKEIYGFK